MGCCLVAALLLSFGRRGWSALTGREPVNPFPPAARRAAPDAAPPAPPVPVVATPRRPVLAAPMAAALTVLVYVVSVGALSWLDRVEPSSTAAVGALPRDLLWTAVMVALAVVGLRSAPRGDAGATGRALAAAGLTWTVLLLVDVHVLRRVEVAAPVLDVGLHLLGLAVLYAGLLLWRPLARPAPAPRTARRTARPETRPLGARP